MENQALEIDYSDMPSTAAVAEIDEWEPPVHKYFGPKNPKTGKKIPEPVYVHQEYPRTMYALKDGKITARLVKSDAEVEALGAGWEKSPAKFGFISAPSYEQVQEMKRKLSDATTIAESKSTLGLPAKKAA